MSASLASELDAILALVSAGQAGEAAQRIEAYMARHPSDPAGWRVKGVVCAQLGRPTAIPCFMKAIQLKPDFKEACADLAFALEKSGQISTAIKTYEHLLIMEQIGGVNKAPPAADAANEQTVRQWFNQGLVFQRQGDPQNAAQAFSQVLTLRPSMPEALVNLGLALYSMRRFSDAEGVILNALRIKPGVAEALNILGSNYAMMGSSLRAIAAWTQAVTADPKHLGAWVNLAKEYSVIKRYDDSIRAFERAVALEENADTLMSLLHMLHILCRWDKAGDIRARARQALIENKKCTEPFFVTVHFPELQRGNAGSYSRQKYPAAHAYDPAAMLPCDMRGDGKLRIGYWSGDYHGHAIAYLVSEMFALHDRERFEVYAYSYGPDSDGPERTRIMQSVDRFCDMRRVDDASAYAVMVQDGIDIMIDLKGYTTGSRLGPMALRPAPVQMHYLGFPGTGNAPFIDYFISDHVASLEGAETEFAECLIRLPHAYQINDRLRPLPTDVPPRTAYGLPEQGIVLCDFNNACKISRDIFAVWMRLLSAVEGSVLWLYESDGEATDNMRHEAERLGVDPARIIAARSAPLAHHLARYHHADLFLDTINYNGHTTVSDALWCGVPVVTLAGQCFASRVAASLLQAVGLPELVTHSLEEYESLALSLMRDKQRLAGLRHHLEAGRMRFPLFDSLATTRAIEAAYLHAASLHRSGQAPRSFNV